jgi:hypothetical protein
MHFFTAVFVVVICCSFLPFTEQQYTPDWASIDSRPLPTWYDESKIGIFINWGVYSVPSISSEWYVFQCSSSIKMQYVAFLNFMKNRTSILFIFIYVGCGGNGKDLIQTPSLLHL